LILLLLIETTNVWESVVNRIEKTPVLSVFVCAWVPENKNRIVFVQKTSIYLC